MFGWLFGAAPGNDPGYDDDFDLTPDLIEDEPDRCHFDFIGCTDTDDLYEIEHTDVPMLICGACYSQL